MPRKLTKNAAAVVGRTLERRVRREFEDALDCMSPFDKALLADILTFYCSAADHGRGEVGLATAFESSLHSMYLVVVDANEYDAILKRLEEAEAFRRKVTIMPARDVA